MIVTIYHGECPQEEYEKGEPKECCKELIECDDLKVFTSTKLVRLLFYQNGNFKDNREFTDHLRAFVSEKGKTVDRIIFNKKKDA